MGRGDPRAATSRSSSDTTSRGAASFHHHRTLHGGLRYLQTADLSRLRESVRERRIWAHIAPQFIAPQQFAVIAGGPGGKAEGLLHAGFAADALLAWDRNRGVAPSLHLPPGRVIDATERRGIDTGALLPPGSLGLWYDYRTEHAERLTFSVALAAASAGAVLANYVDAIEPIREGRTVAGIVARDSVDGAALRITANVTINATGAAAGRLMAAFGIRWSPPLVKAMNLVTTRPAPEVACGATSASGRLLFALPWQGRLSIGTWHGSKPCGADASMVTPDELESFLTEVNQAFPSLDLGERDVALVQRGVVPANVRLGKVELADRADRPRASRRWHRRRDHADGREIHHGASPGPARRDAGDGATRQERSAGHGTYSVARIVAR